MGTEFLESMESINECEFVASKANCWAVMKLLFVDICIFHVFSRAEVYGQSGLVKKVFKPMNINFAFEALRKLAIYRYGGFEFKAVCDKWLHKTAEKEEECTKQRKQTPTRQQPFKKGHIGISESSTHGALLLEKVFCGLQIKNDFHRWKQNKVVRV